MKLPRDASLDSGMSGFPYGSVCLIEADDGNQRDLTPTALSALASADAVIHDTGICKAIIDLVKPPQYLEAAGPEWAIKRSIKLARDHWRVVHLVAGNAAGGAVECATRYAEQCIPFSIMSNTYSPLDDDGPLVLLLVHKVVLAWARGSSGIARLPGGYPERGSAVSVWAIPPRTWIFDVGSRRLATLERSTVITSYWSTPPMSQPAYQNLNSSVLLARLIEGSEELDLPERLITVRRTITGHIVFTTSFGIEDQAITDAIFTAGLAIDVVTLDTGRLFPETLEVWSQTERRYCRQIRGLSPDRESIEKLIERDGAYGFRRSLEARLACCALRKVEPLGRALADASAWITGLRADQSPERARTSYAGFDLRYQIIKVNPLFDWSRDRVVAFVHDHGVPYNPLHDRGFLSIGCAPCTRAVAAGEPERAGRWWWEQEAKTECGCHTRDYSTRPVPAQSQS